jgi:predicted dehydrogenase
MCAAAAFAAKGAVARAAGPEPIVSSQIGTSHAHAAGKISAMLAAPADWRVIGWVESDAGLRESAANRDPYRKLPPFAEEALLATPGLRAVAVETDFHQATDTALRALEAGKHVHLDKPGGIRHRDFVAMRQEAERKGLTVQMGYMLRYNPAFELLFRAVRQGWLGDVIEIDASMGKLGDPSIRRQITDQAGGAMFEIGCHLIDAVVTLLGKPTRVDPFSTPSRDDGVADNQLAVLVYPRATANIRANFADPFGGPRRRFNVTGTRGTLEIVPLESGRVQLSLDRAAGDYQPGQRLVQLDVPRGRYDGEFADLAKVIRGEKRLDWDAAHDIAVHETTLRAAGIWDQHS